jgi:hypothetical protein
MEVAVVGRLNAGSTLQSLPKGLTGGWAIQATTGVPQSSLFVAYTTDPTGTLAALQASSAVASAGLLLAQSSNPAYFGCEHSLADSPGAHALVASAEQSMINTGYATSTQLNDPSTTYLVSDDPTEPGIEIVTAELNSPVSTGALEALNAPDNPAWDTYYSYLDSGQVTPPNAEPPSPLPSGVGTSTPLIPPGTTTFLAAEVTNSLQVTAVGFGAWYSASPQNPQGP